MKRSGAGNVCNSRVTIGRMETLSFSCPWCGEANELPLEPEELGQQVLMDCWVCCRPIEIDLPLTEDGQPTVRGEGE